MKWSMDCSKLVQKRPSLPFVWTL